MDKNSTTQGKKALTKAIDDALMPLAAVKKASNWYVQGEDNLAIMNLQRSKWGNQYYINISLFLGNTTAMEHFPQEYKADIRIRLDHLLAKPQAFKIQHTLDFDNELELGERENMVRNTVIEAALPLIRSMLKNVDVLNLNSSGMFSGAFLSPKASSFFRQFAGFNQRDKA